jgi:LuxR family transcriptional regulator, maltose regulon positive regulatory protein
VVSRPRLVGRLATQAWVSVVSAPPGSGKTVLLRSWISRAGVAGSAAWVPAGRGERDPHRFWLSVLAALRQTAAGSALVRELTAAPDLDGWVITERLLTDLAPLDDQLSLVVDDVHELGSDALRQLELLIMLARRIGRPFLEFTASVYAAAIRAASLPVDRSRQAAELAELHGWTDEPAVGFASAIAARVLIWQGRMEEAEPWIQRAEGTLRAEAEPAVGLAIHSHRGQLELARGRDADALAAFQAADRLAGRLAEPSLTVLPNRSFLVQTLVGLGETERAERALAGLGDNDQGGGEMRISLATLRLAQNDPRAAIAALAPVLDGSAPVRGPTRLAQAFLLEAIARDALGDPAAAGRAVERALDLAEPDGVLLWFVLHPAPDLLEHHARHGTAHADILSLLAGRKPAPPPAGPPPPLEPLSDSEIRVLRYLPTNLSGPEIAGELYVSLNTVRTHMRHLYAKLGTHRRADTVARARVLGLLAPSPHRGQPTRPG